MAAQSSGQADLPLTSETPLMERHGTRSHFPFLELPRELRDMIYEELIWVCHEEREIREKQMAVMSRPDIGHAVTGRQSRNIPIASKQVSGEFLKKCYEVAQAFCYFTGRPRPPADLGKAWSTFVWNSMSISCPTHHFAEVRHCQICLEAPAIYHVVQVSPETVIGCNKSGTQNLIHLLPKVKTMELTVRTSYYEAIKTHHRYKGHLESYLFEFQLSYTGGLKYFKRKIHLALGSEQNSPGLELLTKTQRFNDTTRRSETIEDTARDLEYWELYFKDACRDGWTTNPEWFGGRVSWRQYVNLRRYPRTMRSFMDDYSALAKCYSLWKAAGGT